MRIVRLAGRLTTCAAIALLLSGCPKKKDEGKLTAIQAREALEESTASSEARALTSSSIEISTTFTIGGGVAKAAQEIQTFVQSQLPCAGITLADATLTVTYGAKPGNCRYRGQTFSGTHAVRVSKNENNQVIVDHTWKKLSNGKITVDGTAHVTWDFQDAFRKVEHDFTWARSDGRSGKDYGMRTQRPLSGGLAEGIQIDGDRTWEGKSGKWSLAIEGVQARWIDPIPQAGTYRLATPDNKSLTLIFERVDDDTISVTLSNGNRSFSFNVNSIGAVDARS